MNDAYSQLAGRRVLVTGASGFLGRHLSRRLVEIGALVHGLGRGIAPEGVIFQQWHQVDCTDMSALRVALHAVDPDTIFHLAGYANGRRELELMLPTLHGDLVTAVNLLTAATEHGCRRIVLAGSFEEPAAEDPRPEASSPYAAAKWASTVYARMFRELYRTPVIVGRVFMTYGPGQRDAKLIPYVIQTLLGGQRPQLGGGERPVDWIYVDDTVRGLVTLAVAEGIEGEVLDIGSGELVTVRQIVTQIAELLGKGSELEFGALPPRSREIVAGADVFRTTARTGWRPEVSLPMGLQRTILSYQVGSLKAELRH